MVYQPALEDELTRSKPTRPPRLPVLSVTSSPLYLLPADLINISILIIFLLVSIERLQCIVLLKLLKICPIVTELTAVHEHEQN